MSGMLTEIPAVPVLVPLVVVLLLVAWLKLRDRLVPACAAVFYLAGVLAVTLLPMQIATGDHANQIAWYEKGNILPIVTIDPVTFVLNIMMTMPFGFLLPMLRRIDGVRQVALWSFAFSASIEGVQWATNILVSSGRTADVNDLFANTLGGVLGFLVWRSARRVVTPVVSN